MQKTSYGTGRYLKRGYVMVFQKGHPRVANTQNNYVQGHILIMEKYLGRYLYANENVHHINGIRDDNSIDNLELWIRPQPSGIRASDALIWAREILKAYSPIKDKL